MSVGVLASLVESVRAHTVWLIDRWDEDATNWCKKRLMYDKPWREGPWPLLTVVAADFERLKIRPYATSEVVGNLVTTAGWTRITSLIIAGGGQAATNTSARIGTGNGTGSAAAGDTDLGASAGSSNRWFQVMDATYPQASSNVNTFKATFGSSDGNYAWNEFGIDIGTPTVSSGNTVNATLLNHKTSIAQGTKASGQVWAATATITFT
jgi:hypothetical protein